MTEAPRNPQKKDSMKDGKHHAHQHGQELELFVSFLLHKKLLIEWDSHGGRFGDVKRNKKNDLTQNFVSRDMWRS